MGKLTAKQVIAYSKTDPKKYSDGGGLAHFTSRDWQFIEKARHFPVCADPISSQSQTLLFY